MYVHDAYAIIPIQVPFTYATKRNKFKNENKTKKSFFAPSKL